LTLSGTASLANYQSALRSVTYSDSNGSSPSTGSRAVSFQVDDGAASNNLSNTVSRTINVNPNPPPTAGNVSASTDKHTAIDINVLSSASDPDGEAVSLTAVNTTGTKGVVSINGNGTIHYDPNGQFQSLLLGQTATDSFGYTVSDGFHTASATVTVTINGLNDPPVLANVESSTLQYNAGTPAVQVTSTLTASSPDTTTLAGATVSISSGLAASEDSLEFTNQNGITGSYNASTGVLTLTGTASVADYQTALRSVSYSDSNGAGTGSRTVSFQVDDGLSSNNLSNVVSRPINVNPNSPPTAVNDSASTDKHTAVDINVLANDSDPDGDALAVQSVNTAGTLGSVSINGNGTVHYDPNGQFQNLTAGQTATDTFTYTVSDGFTTATATVTVTITGVNDPPVVSNVETSPLSYRAQDPAVQITNALTISDDDDATMSSATASITSGFSAANDTLAFTNQNGITGSYNASTGVLTLLGNASIANYQTALRSVQFFTSDGSVSPASRTVSFTVTDSVGATSTAVQRTIAVAEANQPPIAINHSYTAVGNTPLGVGTSPSGPAATVSGSLLNGASDPDSGGAISLTGNTSPAHGTVTVNPDGTFTYLPNPGFSGTDSFTYTITDSDDPANPKSATATATITVGPVVWYVDNSKSGAGNGEAGTPFNTLAAANSAAGANSIIFLYQGNATYTGGVSLHSGEDLFGQPHGLTVDGFPLVAAGGSTPTITNSGGDGIDLGEGSDVEAVNVSSPSGNGVAASGVNAATVGGSNTVAISGASGDGIHISGGNATLNFAQTSVTGSTGHSLSIASHTGGTSGFGGNITDNGTGITLSGNSGATINLSGTLTISTGTHAGFSATGGGTITATASANTLATTTATALNVANTTIGASGLTFRSISSSGASSGIVLNSTGSSGGLTVTGNGGSCTVATPTCTGGSIQSSTAEGIVTNNANNLSFSLMKIQNSVATGSAGVKLLDTSGSITFTDVLVTGTSGTNASNVQITTSPASTKAITTLTVTNGAFNNSAGNDGFLVDLHGSASLATASITGATFAGNLAKGLQFQQNDNSVMGNGVGTVPTGTVTVSGSTFTGNNVAASFEGGGGTNGTGSAYYRFVNNGSASSPILGIPTTTPGTGSSHALNFADGSDSAGGTYKALISGNFVGNASTAQSGSAKGDCLRVFMQGQQAATVTVLNNTLRACPNGRGIDVAELGRPTNNSGQTPLDVKIAGNDVNPQDTTGFPLYGIYVAADAQGTGTSGSNVHAEIHGNTVPSTSACDTQCSATTGMIDYETVSGATGTTIGTLYNFDGVGAAVSSEIANNNTGTSGKTCSFVNGGSLTLTASPPNTVP
jgi:VCBS repeat-containing protein